MSTRRDLVWFKKTVPNAGTVAAAGWTRFNATANDTNLFDGALAYETHKGLRGHIEQLIVYLGTGNTTDTGNVNVMFFSGAATGTNLATENYIDYESFVTSDFIAVGAGGTHAAAAAADLKIPYVDKDGAKQFHIAFQYQHSFSSGTAAIKWAWRADRGEP